MAGPDALVCGGQRAGTGPGAGRLAQRESASFTPRRSLVRSQYRPPRSEAVFGHGTRSQARTYSSKVQQQVLTRHPGASDLVKGRSSKVVTESDRTPGTLRCRSV